MKIMKDSPKILKDSYTLLATFDAERIKTITNAQKVIFSFQQKNLGNSFLKHKQKKLSQSKRVVEIFKTNNLHHFDIFRKAGFTANENSLSDAIAAILDPNETHGLGINPILGVLDQLKKSNPQKIEHIQKLVKNNQFQIVVHRERHEENTIPDIEISCSEFVIFIENKVRGGTETTGSLNIWQTNRQWDALLSRGRDLDMPKENLLAVFLTPEGKKAKNKHFIPLSISDMVNALHSPVLKSINPNTRRSLQAFLHYYSWE